MDAKAQHSSDGNNSNIYIYHTFKDGFVKFSRHGISFMVNQFPMPSKANQKHGGRHHHIDN